MKTCKTCKWWIQVGGLFPQNGTFEWWQKYNIQSLKTFADYGCNCHAPKKARKGK